MSEPSPELAVPGPTPDFPVVGIGASAGGLKALLDLFGAVRPDSGMAFVVILHLSPEHESHIAELLQKVTPIPILQVRSSVRIEKDRIYVISPKSHLVMHDLHLEPRPQGPRHGGPMTIDRFFETLAEAHRQCAFCIVLSGSGSDGTRGTKSVRAHGGVTLAQSPDEAEYDSMPRNVIDSGAADFVLPVCEMPAKLESLWDNARSIRLPAFDAPPSSGEAAARAEEALKDVLLLTKARTRHDFSQYKRPTLLRRIERRLQVNQLPDLPSYRDFVREHPGESRHLLRDLLISVTEFFRDDAAFEALEKTFVPALFAERMADRELRIWVVGCATGEEAYSIAMLIAEHAATLAAAPEFSLFATDIDEQALAFARAARYPESIREQVSPARLQRFFVKDGDGFRVQPSLREKVLFAAHNVMQDPPFSRLDLVSCRNLLIYLDRNAQSKVLDVLHFALRPDGYLLLGRSEAVEERDGFAAVDTQNRVFQRQQRMRKGLEIPSMPTLPRSRAAGEMLSLPERQVVSYGELHHRLLEHYGPPSVVVDDRYEVVHVSQSAGRYLQFGLGEPSASLLKLVPESMRFELRSGLDQAMQSMDTVRVPNLAMRRGPEVITHLDVSVHPVRDRMSSRTFALVLFEEVATGRELSADQGPLDGGPPDRGLADRLQETEARLRAVVEQYGLQSEAAKAANEELQSTNEELRATSEELETGKEELQSINEELTTVNQELRSKVDEAARVGDDLRNFITATEIAALFVDRDVRLLRFTPFARQVFNVIDGDVGRPLLDITHRLVGVAFDEDLRAVIETLRIVEREVRGNDGRWYQMRILPYRSADDRIGGAVLTFVDVSSRKAIEETVRQSEGWLRLLIESVRDYAIMRLDPAGTIRTWNPAAESIFGYTESEAVGEPFAMLFTAEDRDGGLPEATLRRARETGRAAGELWEVRKDGTRFYASGVTAPLLDPDAFGYVTLLRDLTQQRVEGERREALLASERESRAAAEAANRLKDQFLATLSHELRNPLALILMQSELLLRAPELQASPRLANATGIIHQMVRAQTQFVDDMMDVSRARTGKLALDRQLLPLPFLVADSMGALRDEAEANQITLEVEITQETLIVEADPVRVKQIAWNLLSNAIKFTPRGGKVTVRLQRDGSNARLDVEDTGRGIDPDVLPQIFNWFWQADTGADRRTGGMGIGLALVRQLVELHGGRVEAFSAGQGQGARFSVWLPLQNVASRSAPATSFGAEDQVPAPAGRLGGLRLLIIDDLRDNAEAMGELLRYEDATVDVDTTARDAIARAQRERYDVIVSDIAMPGMDGVAMLRRMREAELNARTPAIAYSGYGAPEDVERSKAAGFQLHLTKPIDIDGLVRAILEVRRS